MIESHKYVTYKEICDIINQLEDYRDKVLLMLIFDGFYADMDNIQNLTTRDLRESHYKYLGNRRISGATNRVIYKALTEREVHTYSKFNNGIDQLIPSDYILRERIGYKKRSDIEIGEKFNGYAMNKQAIVNRFVKLKRKHGFKFSLSSLYASGVIHRGRKCLEETDSKPRVKFLKFLKEQEGVTEGMGYLYYKEYIKLKPRLTDLDNKDNEEVND